MTRSLLDWIGFGEDSDRSTRQMEDDGVIGAKHAACHSPLPSMIRGSGLVNSQVATYHYRNIRIEILSLSIEYRSRTVQNQLDGMGPTE